MLNLTEGLNERGHHCDMLCAAEGGKPYTVELDHGGRIFAVRSLAKIKATMISPAMILRLRKITRNYDIIHVHHPDPMAALALRLSGFRGPVILHWHADILRQRKLLRLVGPMLRWLVQRADCIVTTSPVYISSPWLTQAREKCVCVPIGIDEMPEPSAKLQELKQRFPDKKIIFAIGRLVSYKGFEFLIKSFVYLPENYVCIIGGTGPLKEQLSRLIDDNGLSDRVMLAGYIDDRDLSAYFCASSVFCLSSVERTEAFGVVQLEAMACATPIVATQIEGSGVPWVNADGVSGLNVPPRRPDLLADAILKITADPATRATYSQQARERFNSLFTKKLMIDHIIETYIKHISQTGL